MSVDDTQYIERVIFYVFFRIVQGIYSCNESASWEQSAWQNHYEDVLSLFHNSQRPLIHSAGIFCVPTNWGIRCIMNISNNFYHWHFTGLYRGWWLVVIQPVYNIFILHQNMIWVICCQIKANHQTFPVLRLRDTNARWACLVFSWAENSSETVSSPYWHLVHFKRSW